MIALNWLAYFVAFAISAGEVARFWGDERFIPMALDELLIASALLLAAWRAAHDGVCWHVAAWGAFCGLTLVLLVETANHELHGPAKANGYVYLVALTVMQMVGLSAVGRALRLLRRGSGR